MSDLYDTDIVRWSEQQASLLRRRAANEVDWDNVAGEIEGLSRTDKREIRSRLAVICEHLLKLQFQPEERSNSWRDRLREARREIADLLEESPSLATYSAERLPWAYARAKEKFEAETGLLHLPDKCPWTLARVLSREF